MFEPKCAKPSALPYSYTLISEMSLAFRSKKMSGHVTVAKRTVDRRGVNLPENVLNYRAMQFTLVVCDRLDTV